MKVQIAVVSQPPVAVAQLWIVRQQEIDDANKRKTSLVSCQEIWLGLGITLLLAGVGHIYSLVGLALCRGCSLFSRQAFGPLDCLGYRARRCYVHYLSCQRREATLALG